MLQKTPCYVTGNTVACDEVGGAYSCEPFLGNCTRPFNYSQREFVYADIPYQTVSNVLQTVHSVFLNSYSM